MPTAPILTLEELIDLMPKVELHTHLEGTLSPALIKKLAAKNQVTLPADLFTEDGEAIFFKDFAHFLTQYDVASSVIATAEDLEEITYEYLRQCHEDGCIYVELTVSPDHMQHLPYLQKLNVINHAILRARTDFEIEARVIIVLVRHFGVERCEALMEAVIANPHPVVVGIGLAGAEAPFPPHLFAKAFKRARDAGLPCTAHAGEWTCADDVMNAVDHLKVKRIGHGIHAAFDEHALTRLRNEGIHLEVCPFSNYSLNTAVNYPAGYTKQHPIQDLYEHQIRFSLSTDDKPFFKTNMRKEYQHAQKLLNISPAALLNVTRHGIEDSFASADLKLTLLRRLQQFEAKYQASFEALDISFSKNK